MEIPEGRRTRKQPGLSARDRAALCSLLSLYLAATAGEMGVRPPEPGPAWAIQKRAVPALCVKICTWYNPPEGDANCQNRSPTTYGLCVPRPTGATSRPPP